jgi:hypothetical protein
VIRTALRRFGAVLWWPFHRLAHAMQLNQGHHLSYVEDGKHMIAFKCECGQVSGAHEAGVYGYDA